MRLSCRSIGTAIPRLPYNDSTQAYRLSHCSNRLALHKSFSYNNHPVNMKLPIFHPYLAAQLLFLLLLSSLCTAQDLSSLPSCAVCRHPFPSHSNSSCHLTPSLSTQKSIQLTPISKHPPSPLSAPQAANPVTSPVSAKTAIS